jgi:hypothetical protein
VTEEKPAGPVSGDLSTMKGYSIVRGIAGTGASAQLKDLKEFIKNGQAKKSGLTIDPRMEGCSK